MWAPQTRRRQAARDLVQGENKGMQKEAEAVEREARKVYGWEKQVTNGHGGSVLA